MAVDGDIAFIGAEGSSPDTPGYVNQYRYDGIQWILEATFTDDDPDQRFGSGVAVDGNTLLIAAKGSAGTTGYVNQYWNNGTQWVLEQVISGDCEGFGRSVALSGDIMLLGDCVNDDNNEGGVQTYLHDGTAWTPSPYDVLSIGGSDEGLYGTSVAIDGFHAMVGVYPGYSSIEGYEFFNDDGWQVTPDLITWGGAFAEYGSSLSLTHDANVLFVGAPGFGFVKEYHRVGDGVDDDQYDNSIGWALIRTISDDDYGQRFGSSVAADGNTLLIGAEGADPNDPGQTKFYRRSPIATGACCVSDCGLLLDCHDITTLDECDDLSGQWSEGAACIDGCSPVQWTIEEGGNGHWYQAFHGQEYLCWSDAQELASALGGHLATLTSDEENEWIKFGITSDRTLWVEPEPESTFHAGPFIGGTSDNCEFSWVTGEEWGFEDWASGPDCENPNNGMILSGLSFVYGWHDVGLDSCDVTRSYLVEWSADCNDDGIVDYGQILDGTLLDEDCDGIPDVCQIEPLGACCTGDTCVIGLDEAGCTALSGLYVASAYCSEVDCSDIATVDDDGVNDPANGQFTDIQAAIFYSGKSTILVQPGTYAGDIRLPAGFTLIGIGGASQTIIDGGGSDPVAELTGCSDAGSEALTTIRGIRFANGSAQEGAGLYCDSCDVLVVECEFIDNSASAYGGGIAGDYQADNTVTLIDCLFAGNDALQGGAGWFNNNSGGGVTATGCRFESNIAFSRGGGLFLDNQPSSTVSGCEFVDNFSGEYGGGIEIVSSSTDITNSQFTQNTAGYGDDTISAGGGLRALTSNLTVTGGCIFNSNSSFGTLGGGDYFPGGGAIWAGDCNSVLISDSTLNDNTAIYAGGGVYAYRVTSLVVNDCNVTNNIVTGMGGNNGGGFLCYLNVSSTFTRCTVSGNSACWGGGFNLQAGTHDFIDCDINSNIARGNDEEEPKGGGIFGDQGSAIGLSGTTACGNTPDQIHQPGNVWTDNGGNTIRTSCDYLGAWVVDDDLAQEPLADFTDIQSAVDAASDGDEILVMAGTYNENIELDGKSIFIRSDAGPDATVISGGGNGSVIRSVNAVNSTIELEGLTLTNGTGSIVEGWLSG
ncbi:MAG: hypothetical protein CMJ24_08015, partial [Phycisphaerae bacterium]|nr:hypothetical protein [Phycisphaerae bacterium]